MSNEEIGYDEAQKLLEDSYNSISKNEAPATPPAPTEPVVVEEPTTPPVEPSAPPANPTQPTPPDPTHHEPPREQPANQPAPQEDPYAWVESLPEETRAKVIQEIQAKLTYEHQFRSNNGRIRNLQQKLLEAQKQISESRPATKPATAERQPPSTPEGWQELMKNEPDLAAAIEARVKSEIESAVGSVKSELQEFKKTAVDPLHEHQREQYVEHQRNELKRLVPNYEQVVSDPNYPRWLETVASPGMRHLALHSVEASDAYTVMQQYANDMVRMGIYKPAPAATPAAPPPAPQNNEAADKLAAARAAKLNSPPPTSQTPIAPVGGPTKAEITVEEGQAMLEKIWAELNPKR
jgi:hypothetical protein